MGYINIRDCDQVGVLLLTANISGIFNKSDERR